MLRVQKLEINNFRGIEHLVIDFHEQINIFIGDNGCGKSSILDCLAVMLSLIIRKVGASGERRRLFNEQDITNKQLETENIISVNFRDKEIEWKISKGRSAYTYKWSFTTIKPLLVFKMLVEKSCNEDVNLPLVTYYPVNRSVLDVPLRIRKKHAFDQLAAYDQALTGKRNDFRVFFEWFRNREDVENEIRLENQTYRDRQLEAVRQAIKKLLPDFSELRVRRQPLRMTVRKGDKELIINQLSDGEKCLLAMLGDLARRLAIANPSLDYPLEGSGVVLIDEIDLHLHPSWQRMIVPALTRTFPNCQFILTTHSPQIIGHVRADSIFKLKRIDNKIELSHPEASYGLDSNRILEDTMDVPARDSLIKEQLSKLFLLIHEGKISEAKQLTIELRENIGNDPELVKADVIIRRKEIIGR